MPPEHYAITEDANVDERTAEPFDKGLRSGFAFEVEKPVVLARDLQTGRAVLAFVSSFPGDGRRFDTPINILLTTEAAKALLSEIHNLEALLLDAINDSNKFQSVQ
jgi:hypothetical protein